MKISRKEFLHGALAIGVLTAASACTDGDPGDEGGDAGPPDCNAKGARAQITAPTSPNHGHVLVIPVADITAGVDKTYDIRGSAPHNHQVTVTAADFATLASNGTPPGIVSTDFFGHTHTITLICV
jgi:hypothetical protein